IGVFRGSLAETLLKQWGFKNVESCTTDAQCVKMLKFRRLDAWVAPLSFKSRYKEKGGLGDDELRAGATLLILHEYLAGSKTLDSDTVHKWQKAFEAMKQDGSYVRIMKKYGLKPLR
ncbi:MAG: transporter substrate-binding domain-containing protein, partial [Bacteriovorax sp.]|nr:transporter substrate-binding domain-containing protein [Bacteriovorax sp.]